MKNTNGWNVTSLEYNPSTDETYIVCGRNRQYKIPGKWTPETMIYALKHLQMYKNEEVK